MTIFKRTVSLTVIFALVFPTIAFSAASSNVRLPGLSVLETQALSAAAQWFFHESRFEPQIAPAAGYPEERFRDVLNQTPRKRVSPPLTRLSFGVTLGITAIAAALEWHTTSSVSSAGMMVYPALGSFLLKLANRFRPVHENRWATSIKNFLRETSAYDKMRPSDVPLALKTLAHLLGDQNLLGTPSPLYQKAASLFWGLLAEQPTLAAAPASSVIALADVLLHFDSLLEVARQQPNPQLLTDWAEAKVIATIRFRAMVDLLLHPLDPSLEEESFYQRMLEFRALMKAEAVRQKNREPLDAQNASLLSRAMDLSAAIQGDHVKTLDTILAEYEEQLRAPWLTELLENRSHPNVEWQTFVSVFPKELGLTVRSGSLADILAGLQASPLDEEEREAYSQLAALYFYKAHLVQQGLSWEQAGNYPIIVSRLERLRDRPKRTKRALDSSVVAALLHSFDETGGVPALFDALSPEVITTVAVNHFIAQSLNDAAQPAEAQAVEMHRTIGEPTEEPVSVPSVKKKMESSTLLPTLWMARYWLYFLRQLSSELQYGLPQWLARFHSERYAFARNVFPFSSSDNKPVTVQSCLSNVVKLILSYRVKIAKLPAPQQADTRREYNRLMNDFEKTKPRLDLTSPLLIFLEQFSERKQQRSIETLLKENRFRPVESDPHAWIGRVGLQTLLIKFPDAQLKNFEELVQANPAAQWVDLLNGSVVNAGQVLSLRSDTPEFPWINAQPIRVIALLPGSEIRSISGLGEASPLSLVFAVVRQNDSRAAQELVRRANTGSLAERVVFRAGLQKIVMLGPDEALLHFSQEQRLPVATLVSALLKSSEDVSSAEDVESPDPFRPWFLDSEYPEDKAALIVWEQHAKALGRWAPGLPLELLAGSDTGALALVYGKPNSAQPEFHVLTLLSSEFDPGHSGDKTWTRIFLGDVGDRMGLQRFLVNVFPTAKRKILKISDSVTGEVYDTQTIQAPDRSVQDWSHGILKEQRVQLLDVTVEDPEFINSPRLRARPAVDAFFGQAA